MIKLLKKLIADKDAASAVEYTVLMSLIAAAIILAVQNLGNTLSITFSNMNSAIVASAGNGGDQPDGHHNGDDDDDGGHHNDDDDDDSTEANL